MTTLIDHFVDLAVQGMRSGCSSSEHTARQLALAVLNSGRLDDHAVEGFIEFIRVARGAPTTARDLVNAWSEHSGVPDKHSDGHLATLDRMERTGGGFVQALAVAWRKADQANHAKLYSVFGDYYHEYQTGARR